MAKPIKTVVTINLTGGAATPAPPVGTALGQHGVNIMEFVKAYNEKTADKKGQVVPAVITIYQDRSFDFITKVAPTSDLIKKELGIKKGSGKTGKETIATLTHAQTKKIAEEKLADLNTQDLDQAVKIVEGTARSMGIKVEK